MVLDRRLTAAGDEEDLLDAVRYQLLDHVLHDGLARYGQHFLGLGLGSREKTSAETGDRDNRAFNHLLNITCYIGQRKGEAVGGHTGTTRGVTPANRPGRSQVDEAWAPAEPGRATPRIHRRAAERRGGKHAAGAALRDGTPLGKSPAPRQRICLRSGGAARGFAGASLQWRDPARTSDTV